MGILEKAMAATRKQRVRAVAAPLLEAARGPSVRFVAFGSAARMVVGRPWPKGIGRRPRDIDVAWVAEGRVSQAQADEYAAEAKRLGAAWAHNHGFDGIPVEVRRGLSVEEPVAEGVDHGAVIELPEAR